MAITFVKIQTVTVGTAVAAIDFTSIPQNYTDLKIVHSCRSDANAATQGGQLINLKINGSASNFTGKWVFGSGSGVASLDSTNGLGYSNPSDYTASVFGSGEVYIPNYTSSNNKSISADNVNENNATAAGMNMAAMLWSQTAAITSVSLVPYFGNFVQYSTATLYGIKSS